MTLGWHTLVSKGLVSTLFQFSHWRTVNYHIRDLDYVPAVRQVCAADVAKFATAVAVFSEMGTIFGATLGQHGYFPPLLLKSERIPVATR